LNRTLPLLPLFLVLAAPVLSGASCKSKPDEKATEQALLYYDMGIQAMQQNDARAALAQQQKAIELDPDLDLAHNALGVLYHNSYADKEKAIYHYKRALEINPKFSEAYTNLGNVYLSMERYDDAMPLYERALSDILYKTPYVAENNLGWCYYKKGLVQQAIDHIKSALVPNPKFCLGYRNLGVIYTETKQPDKAVASFAQFAKQCPEVADAHYRFGRALLEQSDAEGARRELGLCVEKGKGAPAADDCQRLLDQLSSP
jgi:type IV pilus assembly protein PilF